MRMKSDGVRVNGVRGFARFVSSALMGVLLAGSATWACGQGATGGAVTQSGDYWIHAFTNSGDFVVTSPITNVEYLIVAGGGGGGRSADVAAGGGGGGGVLSNVGGTPLTLAVGTLHPVVVGSGGSGRKSSGGRGSAG
ncbi:MAG: hypothetical protein FJ222_05160, partial [Lentisphaerae bacterium]|nr:hypothetical protein [Lentisphaerota bacterium]